MYNLKGNLKNSASFSGRSAGIIKKVAALTLLTFLFVFAVACNSKPEYFSYVSELRKDVFAGENERFSVVVWAGAREQPYAADGIKNQTSLSLTVKITQKQETGDNLGVTVKFDDKVYRSKTGFHPVKSALCAEICVDKLPEKQLVAEIAYGENSDVITLESKLSESTISYNDALNRATQKASDFLKANTKNGKLNAEIAIKLLCENNRNYYYVSILSVSGEKRAFLIDGETSDVLAERQQ